MWETLFDPSMLDSGKEIAIWCPRHEDVPELFKILAERGIKWNDGGPLEAADRWNSYAEETVYFVDWNIDEERVLLYGDRDVSGEIIRCEFHPECIPITTIVEVGDLI